MTHSPLMYGLIKLHARIDGQIKQDKKNLEHVRAVIKIVEPNFDVDGIKPKKTTRKNPWFKPGEMFLTVLDVLREAKEPLLQTEIAKRMLAKKGVQNPTQENLRDVRNAIHNTLPRYDGKAIKSEGPKKHRRWSALRFL